MVKDWINIHKPLFEAFLETHIHSSNAARINDAILVVWKSFGNYGHHSSGQIIVVWDPSVSVFIYKATEQAVTYGVHILSENINLTVTFVYGFNVVGERQALWNELVEISDTPALQNSTWTVLGDFNKILRLAHHSGYPSHVVDSSGMQEANEALQDAGLFEAQAKGTPFTWSNNNDQDPISKRIDHTLVNQIWADHFRDSYADLLEPGQSDHSPCIVKVPSLRRQSRKPFKFYHHIIDHPDYNSAVTAAWNPGSITGSAQFKLVRTMKMLKKDLRGINKRHFSGISERVKGQSAKGILGETDMPLSPSSVESLKDLLLFRCSELSRAYLKREVLSAEIKGTIFAMPLSKSPGPDVYSVEFLRASWDTVGEDIIVAVAEFFRNGRLLKDLNTTTIVLIPKTSAACRLGDFRLISCCNLVYKVITKIIVNRLKSILQSSISRNQAAFLKGQSLGENGLLASDLIRNYRSSSCPRRCMLKVDIKKAFDTISWDFIIKLLDAQDLPPLFVTWIRECITSPRFSVAINGELAGFFLGMKRPRQGDFISPYLFIMAMEALSKLLDQAVEAGGLRLHPSCQEPRVTHLLFADDLLVFLDGSRHSITSIKKVLTTFKEWTGLDMNVAKSEIFFGGFSEIEASVIADISRFRIGSFPTRYLGLSLNPSRISYATLQPFLERINCWTVKTLSFAGKVTLVASVIHGMVNFWSSVFALPKRFYEKIDSLCSPFSGKIALHLLLGQELVGVLMGGLAAFKCLQKEVLLTTTDYQRFFPTAFGQTGPRSLRLGLESHVCQAARNGDWTLPHARSDVAETLQIVLTTMSLPTPVNQFGFSVEETKRMTGETMVILTGEFKSGDNKTPNRALSEEGLQTLAREIKALTMSMLLSEEENQTASDISLGEP
ncbi:PREDICTED: uncharacterized protein LOC106344925 [Brassica oleracea var. oleracea]|nr:PREDICTED: uncharacterized protein LOC106344925 [Brassica oleracea var. oleracea]